MIVSVCFISLTNVRRFTHFGKLRVYIGELLFKDGYLGEVLFKMVIWERYYMREVHRSQGECIWFCVLPRLNLLFAAK
jgi:hypothetical protein